MGLWRSHQLQRHRAGGRLMRDRSRAGDFGQREGGQREAFLKRVDTPYVDVVIIAIDSQMVSGLGVDPFVIRGERCATVRMSRHGHECQDTKQHDSSKCESHDTCTHSSTPSRKISSWQTEALHRCRFFSVAHKTITPQYEKVVRKA